MKCMEHIKMNNATVKTKNSVERLHSRSDTVEELIGKNLETLPRMKYRMIRIQKTLKKDVMRYGRYNEEVKNMTDWILTKKIHK